MSASKDWNCLQGMVIGALVGATYALLICGVANLLSLRTIGFVIFALIVGSAIGAGVIGGIAAVLNYARAALQVRKRH